jgi:hypothetical protein
MYGIDQNMGNMGSMGNMIQNNTLDDIEDLKLAKIYRSRFWLEDLGWKPGTGLGNEGNMGIVKPLDGVIRPERYGLGNKDEEEF